MWEAAVPSSFKHYLKWGKPECQKRQTWIHVQTNEQQVPFSRQVVTQVSSVINLFKFPLHPPYRNSSHFFFLALKYHLWIFSSHGPVSGFKAHFAAKWHSFEKHFPDDLSPVSRISWSHQCMSVSLQEYKRGSHFAAFEVLSTCLLMVWNQLHCQPPHLEQKENCHQIKVYVPTLIETNPTLDFVCWFFLLLNHLPLSAFLLQVSLHFSAVANLLRFPLHPPYVNFSHLLLLPLKNHFSIFWSQGPESFFK